MPSASEQRLSRAVALTHQVTPVQSEGRGDESPLPPEHHRDGFSSPSPLSSSHLKRESLRSANGFPTALQGIREILLLAAHSQSQALPRTPRVSPPEAPGITPAAHDLPRLVSSFVRAVTSLAGDYPANPPRMPLLHARSQSPRASHALSSGRTQKLPTTHRGGRFAVRHRLRTHSLASAYGFAPFVVELFPARHFVRSPGLGCWPGPSPLGDRKSPRQRS